MATRLYFPATATPPNGLTPAYAGWNYTAEASRGSFNVTKGSSTLAIGTQIGAWTATAGQTALDRQYISPKLKAQTISGTFKGQIMVREFATTDNVDQLYVCVKVVSGDGTTIRSTLYALGNATTTAEFINNATCRNKGIADGDSLSSYACADGDRLVVEIGYRNSTGATTPEAQAKWGESASDLPENETQTTDGSPWIEFSHNFEWLAIQTLGDTSEVSADALAQTATYARTNGDTSEAITDSLTQELTSSSGLTAVYGANLKHHWFEDWTAPDWTDDIASVVLTQGLGSNVEPTNTTTPAAILALAFDVDSGLEDYLGGAPTATGEGQHLGFCFELASTSGTAKLISLEGASNDLTFQVVDGVLEVSSASGTVAATMVSTSLSTGWHTVILHLRSGASEARLYVDGVLQDTDTATFSSGAWDWTSLNVGNVPSAGTLAVEIASIYIAQKTTGDFTLTTDAEAAHDVLYSYINSGLIEQTLSDSVSITDALAQTATFGRTGSDTATSTDGATQTVAYARTNSDAESVTDALTTATVYAQTFADTVSTTDAAAGGLNIVRTFSDTIAARDGAIDPTTLNFTGLWFSENYNGTSQVTGTASAGTSSGDTLDEGTNAPGVGAAINGYDTIDFDGANDRLTTSGTGGDYFNASSGSAIFVVNIDAIDSDVADAAAYLNDALFEDTNGLVGLFLRQTGPTLQAYFDDSTATIYVATCAFATGQLQVAQMRWNGTHVEVRVGKNAWTAVTNGTGALYSTFSTALIRIGAQAGGVNFTNGRFAMVGFSDERFDDATCDALVDFTAEKYENASFGLIDTVTYARSASDALTSTDALLQTVTYGRTATDASEVAVDDLTYEKTGGQLYAQTLSDAVDITDTLSQTAAYARAFADAETVTDALAREATFGSSLADTVTATDALTREATFGSSASDTVTSSDGTAQTTTYGRSASDTATSTDAAAQTVAYARAPTDTETVTDATAQAASYARTESDALTAVDSFDAALAGTFSSTSADAVDVTDALTTTTAYARTQADAETATDAVAGAATFARSAADANAIADAIARELALGAGGSDTATTTDGVSQAVTYARALTDAATSDDAATTTTAYARGFADTIGTLDTVTTSSDSEVYATDAVNATDTLRVELAYERLLADAAALDDVLSGAAAYAPTLSDALEIAEALAPALVYARALADAVDVVDDLYIIGRGTRGGFGTVVPVVRLGSARTFPVSSTVRVVRNIPGVKIGEP